MPARRPDPGEEDGASVEDSPSVAELRRASAAVAALDIGRPAADRGSASDSVAARGAGSDSHAARGAGSDSHAASDREAGADPGPGADFDPGVHAERFEAVHDALVAVLADIDRG